MNRALLAVCLVAALPSCTTAQANAPVAASAPAPMAQSEPLFSSEQARAEQFVAEMMSAGVVVPVPKDPGGGYTHEQHKRNYRAIYQAGQLYRITGDTDFADYVRDMLLAYADLYPTLEDHPARRNQNPGRIFWQVLNDAVWLVHSVQGYAEVRDLLSEADRQAIDDKVFRRAAYFLSVDSQATFDRIHNHATWATAGVGMTGYLLGDEDLVERALLGSDKSGATGFLRQTELLFSPDGYYTEGPYYQRYALMPFMVFADAIERNDPNREIFEHRDGILLKALYATIQLTYDGNFFPFNDAIKDKSLRTDELYHGVAIAYRKTRDPALLSIADYQGRTVLSEGGRLVAADLAAGKAKPFPFRSLLYRDGPDGDQGAVAILRDGASQTASVVVAKNSSQGMGHGHFDKLAWQFYDKGNEVVRDYGAARFLNIEAKQGGRYLPENESWAKQTIAHNTLVVDQQSHFGGDVQLADTIAPDQLYFSNAKGLQISSGRITGAYDDVTIRRTLAMATIDGLDHPIVIDVTDTQGTGEHLLDLPLHFNGHVMEHSFDTESFVTARPVLGDSNGYQHVWVDARGTPTSGHEALTWILDGRFYTYRFVTDGQTEVILGETGANDASFNLRREQMVILRRNATGNSTFVTLLEPHGLYDGAAEQTVESRSQIASLSHTKVGAYDLVSLAMKDGHTAILAISHDPDEAKGHSTNIGGQTLSWRGFARLFTFPGEGQ